MACMAVVAGGAAVAVAAAPGAACHRSSGSSSSSSSRNGAAAAAPSAAAAGLRSSFNGRARSVASFSNARRSGQRFAPLVVKATSSEEAADPAKQFDELLNDAKLKWDKIENKSSVAVYAGGAIVALWLSSTIIGAVNSVPLLPKLLELVGLGYTGWFVYRYLLFKSSRKELVSDIEELKQKITGATKDITGKDELPKVDPPS